MPRYGPGGISSCRSSGTAALPADESWSKLWMRAFAFVPRPCGPRRIHSLSRRRTLNREASALRSDESRRERTHRWPQVVPGHEVVLYTVATTDSPEFYDDALIDAVNHRDYPTVQAIVFLLAMVFLLINLIIDLLYAVLDPRIRYS